MSFTPVTKTVVRSVGVKYPTKKGTKWVLEITHDGRIRIRPHGCKDDLWATITIDQAYLQAQVCNGPTQRERRYRREE